MAVQFTTGRIIGLVGVPGAAFCSNDMETETVGTITSLTHQTNSGSLAFVASRFSVQAINFCSNDMETETVGAITALAHMSASGNCAFTDASSRFV